MQKDLIAQLTKKNREFNLRKYIRMILKNKKYVAIYTFVFAVLFFILFKLFLARPEYTSESLVRFDDPRLTQQIGAVTDFALEDPRSKIPIITTNNFLSELVDTLSLQFNLNEPDALISDVFRSYHALDSLKTGQYYIKFTKEKYRVYYSNNKVKNVLMFELFRSQHRFAVGGMSFEFNPSFLPKPRSVNFTIEEKKNTVNRLRKKITTSLDASRTLLTIRYTGTDPVLTARVANKIADLFVKKTLELKRYKTIAVLKTLGEQLTVARKNLQSAENALEQYRSKNPMLTLSPNLNDDLQQLSNIEVELKAINEDKKMLDDLGQANQTATQDPSTSLKEKLSFLQSRDVPSAQVLLADYNNLLAQRQALLAKYPETHPNVVEVQQRISDVEKRIKELISNFREDLSTRLANNNRKQRNLNNKLRNLPAQETVLAKLVRDKQVNERLFSSVLEKYNEAKIADAAVIPDAYLLDYAMVPERTSNTVFFILVGIIGLIFSFAGGIASVVLWDLVNPSIKDETDIKYDIHLPILSSIPVIGSEESIPKFVDEKDKFKIDSKLITSDYAPNIIGEKYRTLRTHLLFSEKEHMRIKSIVVTSLNANEGKSLNISNLAITIAQQKIPTVLIDTDLRRGVLHRSFVCEKRPGISDLLNSRADINVANVQKIIQKTHVPNLFLISSGTQIPNPSELIGSFRMKQLISVLNDKFGFILFDSPPISVTTDAVILSTLVDKVLFIVRSGRTKKKQLMQIVEQFEGMKEKTLGIIINGTEFKIDKTNYNYSYYHY